MAPGHDAQRCLWGLGRDEISAGMAGISRTAAGKRVLKTWEFWDGAGHKSSSVTGGGSGRQCPKATSLRNYLFQGFSYLPLIYLALVAVRDRILALRYGFLSPHSCPKKQACLSCRPSALRSQHLPCAGDPMGGRESQAWPGVGSAAEAGLAAPLGCSMALG